MDCILDFWGLTHNMNLLKQTALVLGLASLVIGGWAIYRNFRNKISILFSLLCFLVSVWALSFVSYATLGGHLSYDIHRFCNLWLTPAAIALISRILFRRENQFSRILLGVSVAGAVIFSILVSFSLSFQMQWVQSVVNFFPTLIFVEYVYIMVQDLVFKEPMNTDFISPSKRVAFYLGLGSSLLFCTFDHVQQFGYTIPAIGNLFFTVYLVFASQAITPQKLLRIETIVSRFFAILILALIITGFFALLYPYISETFGLFLLNSFLISFAVLALWNPLTTFFRYLASKIFSHEGDNLQNQVDEIQFLITAATNLDQLKIDLIRKLEMSMQSSRVKLICDIEGVRLSETVLNYFEYLVGRKIVPILHRDILRMEREQVLTESQRQAIDFLIQYLNEQKADVVFPVFYTAKVVALILVQVDATIDEWSLSFGKYSKLYDSVQEFGLALVRLTEIEEAKEKDRLILMGEMAAGLAHEVRNPLGAIRGAAELITDDTTPWAKVIQEEVARLNRLVSQFLDFAQDPKEKKETVDLNEVVRISLEQFKSTLPSTVEVAFIPFESRALVSAVPDHLRQVLWNFLQNSQKAVAEVSEPKIQVKVFENGISVSDNGIGMSEDVKERVFQPFFTSFKNGTGLGLSISQRLIHFNGGRIDLETEKGRGTKFTIRLESINER